MKRSGLLIILCFLFFENITYAAKKCSFDTSGIQNDVPMNYPSRIPFNNKIGASNVYIWPNPAKEKIMIYVNSIKVGDEGQCVIYNNSGQPVLTQWIRNGNNNIYLGNVQEGIYIVTVASRNKDVVSKRLVVTR